MTHWRNLAAAVDPPIPAENAEKAAAVLEALEAAFRPLVASIPPGTDVWRGPSATGPEDAA